MTEPHPPRYWPERSLPERAFIPGRGPKPAAAAEQRAPYLSAERWRDNAAYLWGVDLAHSSEREASPRLWLEL